MIVKADTKHHNSTENLVGLGTVVVGDMFFSGGLRVDGQVRGNINALAGHSATLVIGEKGRVDGNVEVTHLVINGLVTGHVYATEVVELRSKAHVTCDVEYAAIEMHSGAVIQGRLLHRRHVAQMGESQEAVPFSKIKGVVA